MPNERKGILIYVLLLTAAFSFRVAVARLLPNAEPLDGQVYAQIARNVVEHHTYSHATEPPYEPSLIRVPGYPFFLAAVYSVFGHKGNSAVHMVQALIDTASCALISLVAFFWEPDQKRKRRTSIASLALAAICPFTTIYVATILAETPTIFLAVAICLTATLALKATRHTNILLLWIATGILAGVAVLFRPDSGLFAAAIGITLVVSILMRSKEGSLKRGKEGIVSNLARAAFLGGTFSLAFCLVLIPWTVRNHRLFQVFQPLAPRHAEMPGGFVPRGYFSWLRTWIDDGRYVGSAVWPLGESPIELEDIPNHAFDSAQEKQRVAALFEKYNYAAGQESIFVEPDSEQRPTPTEDLSNQLGGDEPGKPQDGSTQSDSGNAADETDTTAGTDTSDADDSGDQDDQADRNDGNVSSNSVTSQPVEMTPEIDAGFARIAEERIARRPVRFFFWLPVKRAFSIWFNTHSQYFPFEGELLPLDDLDYESHQQFWLPLFASLTFVYTLLGILGALFLWETRDFVARQWLLMVSLIIFLRLAFFSTVANPEPRYVVEIFPFLSILGGIALSRPGLLLKNNKSG